MSFVHIYHLSGRLTITADVLRKADRIEPESPAPIYVRRIYSCQEQHHRSLVRRRGEPRSATTYIGGAHSVCKYESSTAERLIPPPHPKMINNSRSLNSSAETYCHASMVSAQYEGDFTHPSRHIYWAASADRIVNDPVVYVIGQAIGAVGVTG